MDGYLKIDTLVVKKAVKSKRVYDALCLAVLFKSLYANSCVYSHSIRELKQLTHLGQDRLTEALKMGEKCGLFYRGHRGMTIHRLWKRRTRKNNPNGEYFITIPKTDNFKAIQKAIREQMTLFYISRISWAKNIIHRGAENPYERKFRHKFEHDNVALSKHTIGTIRKSTLAKRLNVSKTTISHILSVLRDAGEITITPNIIHIKGKWEGFVEQAYNDSIYFALYTKNGNSLQTGNFYALAK